MRVKRQIKTFLKSGSTLHKLYRITAIWQHIPTKILQLRKKLKWSDLTSKMYSIIH